MNSAGAAPSKRRVEAPPASSRRLIAWKSALGFAVGALARLWLSTLRVRVTRHPALGAAGSRPWVLAFLHGTQWPLLAWRRRRPTVVLVSWSADGAVSASALACQGLRVVRGSSSRGGATGLSALVRRMRREDADAAFAVDGPRGPRGIVKPGLIVAARATGGVIVPMTGRVRHGIVLTRTWDRYALAWPFTRVDVTLGCPIDPASFGSQEETRRAIERALASLNAG